MEVHKPFTFSYILYFKPTGSPGCASALNILQQNQSLKQIVHIQDVTLIKRPDWMKGVPILANVATKEIWQGTPALRQLEYLTSVTHPPVAIVTPWSQFQAGLTLPPQPTVVQSPTVQFQPPQSQSPSPHVPHIQSPTIQFQPVHPPPPTPPTPQFPPQNVFHSPQHEQNTQQNQSQNQQNQSQNQNQPTQSNQKQKTDPNRVLPLPPPDDEQGEMKPLVLPELPKPKRTVRPEPETISVSGSNSGSNSNQGKPNSHQPNQPHQPKPQTPKPITPPVNENETPQITTTHQQQQPSSPTNPQSDMHLTPDQLDKIRTVIEKPSIFSQPREFGKQTSQRKPRQPKSTKNVSSDQSDEVTDDTLFITDTRELNGQSANTPHISEGESNDDKHVVRSLKPRQTRRVSKLVETQVTEHGEDQVTKHGGDNNVTNDITTDNTNDNNTNDVPVV